MSIEHNSLLASMLLVALAVPVVGCSNAAGTDTNASDTGTTDGAAASGAEADGSAGNDTTPETMPGGASADEGGVGADDGGNTEDGGVDGDGLGPADFDDDELDPPSQGGTITFQEIGAPGWYPSRRDPEVGPCDAYDANGCCMARRDIDGDQMTPWDEDLVFTLRGPMLIKQFAAYRPLGEEAGDWSMVSGWSDDAPASSQGVAFHGNDAESGFSGAVGTECLVDVTTDRSFECGAGSEPFCPESANPQHLGWEGSKLFVLLAAMPHVDQQAVGEPCSDNMAGNWWDAPWIGLSLGELTRAGAFSDCQCYAKSPDEWWLGDGCGQFNVFEVVNDNNEYRNLDVFSTNFFGYGGYVGGGPCGAQCDVSLLGDGVDLIDKSGPAEASEGAVGSPAQAPGAAFIRPSNGYRYFLILMDVESRTVQLGVVHPSQIPAAIDGLLPNLPAALPRTAVDAVLELRLPQ